MGSLLDRIFFSASVTVALAIAANAARANLSPQTGEIVANDSVVRVRFAPPGDAAPKTSVSGGVRGNVQFALLPSDATPKTSVGGGVRGNVVQLALPDSAAPRTSVGGGVRGETQFNLPSRATPGTSVGGGVRGNVQFRLPGGATPRTSVGAGVRGEAHPELTALVPPTKQGRTVSARPTIFVYLPPIGAEEAFLSWQDEEGNPFYKITVKVPQDGGTIAIALPPEAPELQVGKSYLWYFAPIEPGGILRPDNYAVIGWVKRVESTINEQALASSPIELASAYAQAGIWYDTLKVLADAQRSAPDNKIFAQEWGDLLKQVGLEAIASQPLVD